MVKSNKFAGGILVVLGLSMLLAFQNCSDNASLSSTGPASGSINGSSSGDTALTYPSISSSIVLKAGQKITLKFPTPNFPESSANYMWYAYNDGHMLMAKYGLPVFVGGFMYISLSVRSVVTADHTTVRIMLYNYVNTAQGYLDQQGVKVYLSASSSAATYSTDSVSEACTASTAFAPAFKLNRAVAATDALTPTDNGGGLASATCTFNNLAADCFNTSAWPTGWASQTVVVNATSRCGATTAVTFNP
jgi:hypothetical protein